MEEKRDKMAKMIIALLLILVFGMFGYICYDKVFTSSTDKTMTESMQKTEKEGKSISNQDSLIEFDESKCINNSDKASYILSTYDNADGLSMKLSQDKKTVVLTINWSLFSKISGLSIGQSTTEDYTIDNFKQEVENIYIATFGQDIGGTTLVYLMNDGTVEYTPLMKAVSTKEFKSYGKIDDIENVVKFLTADKSISDSSAGITTLAQRADGKFYDLFTPLSKTGNY